MRWGFCFQALFEHICVLKCFAAHLKACTTAPMSVVFSAEIEKQRNPEDLYFLRNPEAKKTCESAEIQNHHYLLSSRLNHKDIDHILPLQVLM